ncbi:MAG: CPBP family intramembrane metalloprotease [Syntrophomonadaceae bacterium]|jgi:membrane protease YdiL (CAAX protease family)|nr:CPBP family intramembrane metalloprotease [Syntrophomonadaceae bacterium]
MIIDKYQHPFRFYSLSIIIPWICWFVAAYLSHLTPSSSIYISIASLLGIIGLVSPMVIAFSMMLPDPELRSDLFNRLFTFKKIKPIYLLATFFLMLASILLAQGISLLFGYSAEQFNLSHGFSFTAGLFPAWFMLFLAPILEELAWHTYGTDCLRQRFSLFKASLIFAIFFAFWHLPLSFIKDYYQANLAEEGLIHSLNFGVSLIPYVLLMNWLYYKTNRNILVVIVFHISAGFFNEIFSTHPDSKIIQTVLLLVLTIFLLIKDRDFFFQRQFNE